MTKIFVNTAWPWSRSGSTPRKPSWPSSGCSGPKARCRSGTSRRSSNQSKPTGYTTVLKTMQIMADKGLVDRDDTVRPQIYRPRHSEDRTQKQLLTDLIQRVYGGSVKALVLHAIGTRKPSAEDLDAIEKLLDRFEGDKK